MTLPGKTVLVIGMYTLSLSRQKSNWSSGANRGIGLIFIKTLKERGWTTISSVRPETRNDASAEELAATGSRIVEIDYKDENTIQQAAKELQNVKLDMLINCAGIAVQPPPWQSHFKSDLMERFEVMTVVRCARYVLQLSSHNRVLSLPSSTSFRTYFKTAAGKSSTFLRALEVSRNDDERFIGYKMAKAALNQLTVTLANDFKKNNHPIGIVAFQPGYIKTKLTGFKGTVDIVESVTGRVNLSETITPEGSPYFLSWKGETMAW
ncbi:unnamed protein product [Periconia digitata]|uniref:NAD(P)-binding protein n=1 Tax=Periconia digitata TaxID=1303443 RepID=A0A9W4UN73_9PLEO|nr:unnamed protein product [Periconia digitata]